MEFIDIHTHITYGNFPEFSKVFLGRDGFTADVLLRRMDMENVKGENKEILLFLHIVLDRSEVCVWVILEAEYAGQGICSSLRKCSYAVRMS